MPEVIPHDQLAAFVENTIAQTYKGIQAAQRQRGLPTYAVEELVFDAVIVTTDGLGALVVVQQLDETAPVINTEKKPEQRQTATTKRRTTGSTTGKTDGKSEGTDTALDNSTDHEVGSATESALDANSQTEQSTVDDTKQYGNQLKVKNTVES